MAMIAWTRRAGGLARPSKRRVADAPRDGAVPPLSPRLQIARSVLLMVLVLSTSMLLHVFLVSSLQQRSSQKQLYDDFRAQLARGTAPTGAVTASGDHVPLGAPIAYLEIRSIGLQQVIVNGTDPTSLFDGPGLRRDTPFPGQAGTSVVFGRKSSYGAPFAAIDDLVAGDVIDVATGQGLFEYRVIGVRREGQSVPPPLVAGGARLMLVSSDGSRWLPSGIVRVDAEMIGTPAVGPTPALSTAGLPSSERAMGNDTSTTWALALWIQALTVLSVFAIWGWHRWGRAQTWVVFLPPLMLVGSCVSAEFLKLVPNLI